ncbi:MAG TPA: ion channel [Pseudomonadales bacterium]|nr:ion channel [Pseudomonadales bacterium]
MDEFAARLQYDHAMKTPDRLADKLPLYIGLRRYSAAEFLVILILFFICAPILESLRYGLVWESAFMTVVLISGVLAVGKSRRTLALAIIFSVPALVARWSYHLRPGDVPIEYALASSLLFVAFLIYRFLGFVLRAPRVNSEVLCAGVSTYLLLGLLWSFAYRLMAELDPHAFVFTVSAIPSEPLVGYKAIYFSLITLTTVGYGDIVPASNVARMLAAMEAITGTLFITVLIARLVALYSSHAAQTEADE